METTDTRPEVNQLLSSIKATLPQFEELLEECNSHWKYEDPIYRFYHQSFKVYGLQATTEKIVELLQSLSNQPLNDWFLRIVKEGTCKKFNKEDNQSWLEVTRPILEAFFHSKYFLEMICRYGKKLEEPPVRLPSGWASVLYLYNLR